MRSSTPSSLAPSSRLYFTISTNSGAKNDSCAGETTQSVTSPQSKWSSGSLLVRDRHLEAVDVLMEGFVGLLDGQFSLCRLCREIPAPRGFSVDLPGHRATIKPPIKHFRTFCYRKPAVHYFPMRACPEDKQFQAWLTFSRTALYWASVAQPRERRI